MATKPDKPILPGQWELEGTTKMSDGQRRLLNAACGDLGSQLIWHGGIRLSKDDYRHMISGTILQWRTMPGIDMGDGRPGWIMLGGSSLDLTKSQATNAINTAFNIGDYPEEQRLTCRPVTWCHVVQMARGIGLDEIGEQIALSRTATRNNPQHSEVPLDHQPRRPVGESGNQTKRLAA